MVFLKTKLNSKQNNSSTTTVTNKYDSSFKIDGSDLDKGNEQYLFKCDLKEPNKAFGCVKATEKKTNNGKAFTINKANQKLYNICNKK